MILLKYNDFVIQNDQSETKITTKPKGYNFGHLKIGGLQVVVSLFITPIDRQSSHGQLAFLHVDFLFFLYISSPPSLLKIIIGRAPYQTVVTKPLCLNLHLTYLSVVSHIIPDFYTIKTKCLICSQYTIDKPMPECRNGNEVMN